MTTMTMTSMTTMRTMTTMAIVKTMTTMATMTTTRTRLQGLDNNHITIIVFYITSNGKHSGLNEFEPPEVFKGGWYHTSHFPNVYFICQV